MDRAIQRGVELILRKHLDDGSWPGLWGVNYMYGIFFCVEGLLAAGLPLTHPAIQRAGQWLLSKQKADGGWGEHWKGCVENRYREHPQSQIIMTSWALLALQAARIPAREAIERGIGWLVSRQLADGSFPEESVAGVFFKTGMLHYALYKNYFPLWALGRFLSASGNFGTSLEVVRAASQACDSLMTHLCTPDRSQSSST